MNLSRLLSACLFGHAESIRDFARDDKGVIVSPRTLVHRCSRCQADLGEVCAGQRFKKRKIKKATKRKSADVLRLERKQA